VTSAALVLLAACARAAAPAAPPPPRLLQVAIVRQAPSAQLEAAGEVVLVEPDGKRSALEWRGPIELKPRVSGLQLADLALKTETRLEPAPGATLRVGKDQHQGALILRLDPGQTVTIVEEIAVEDYLVGVLPHEMDADWPLEALKAQAVVARSFAYASIGKFRAEGFDMTADTRSQVFRGLADVNENVRAAVRMTRGEVLGWDGKLLRGYYHSCCGGHTENEAEVWGGDPKATPRPLRGVRDSWCRTAPEMKWDAYYAWQDIMAAFAARANLPGPLSALKLGRRDVAGFVLDFVGRAGAREVSVSAADIRAALGAEEFKSTRVLRIKARSKGVDFIGAGSGHGVGLCQWGAREQALHGRSYEKILRFYFPGADIAEIVE